MAPGGDMLMPQETADSKASYEARLRNVNFIKITPEVVRSQLVAKKRTQRNSRLETQLRRYQYRVGVGDVLNVKVWEQPELSFVSREEALLKGKLGGGSRDQTGARSGIRVDSRGKFFYPYAGEVRAAGRTVQEIRRILTTKLRDKIIDPQIDVSVTSYRSKRVYLLGEVKRPGPISITDVPLTLVNALNSAGGLTPDAEMSDVVVVRGAQRRHVDVNSLLHYGDMRQDILLRDGDVVHIARNDKSRVFVMGEVLNPGVVPMKRVGLTLADALAAARGIDEKEANARGIFVIRKSAQPDKIADVYQLDARNMTAMVMAADFRLRPADVVYVTAAPVAMWNRLVIQLLPTLSSVNTSTSLGQRFGVIK